MTRPDLTLHLFGGLSIQLGRDPLTGFASRKVEALFVYLACHPRPQPRETLATLLWPNTDQNKALANLSVALSSLRKNRLGPYIEADRQTVGLRPGAAVWIDTAAFENAINTWRKAHQQSGKTHRAGAAQLTEAVSLYSGDVLSGFNVRGAPEFEAWVLLEQERLRQQMLEALGELMRFHQERGRFKEAIDVGQRLLNIDPLQEEVQRHLMTLYVQDNQRPAALAQYEQAAAILMEELGVEPDEETQSLYAQILNEEALPVAEEPPAATHNIPTLSTPFFGREPELAAIERWLNRPSGHLLTLLGPGGIGKTRLAREAARAQIGTFADGVWMISLVPQTDTAGVITAVANALDLSLSGADPIADQLVAQLQTLEALIVLDNLEHLLSQDLLDFLSRLIDQAPELRLITTSRERLRLRPESLIELQGLPVPAPNEPEPDRFAALALFFGRVEQIQPGFDRSAHLAAAQELCQLVGGLPLALELAATWTRVLTLEEIAAEIRDSLDTLSTTLHDVPERHRSLRAVIDSSWKQLPPAEQSLYARLAVFKGGFTRDAAKQVTGATAAQLMTLVDQSFLRLDGDQRFRRHPLLLQFAQEKLSHAAADARVTAQTHAQYFTDLTHSLEADLKGEKAPQALDTINTDYDNIRAAWRWGCEHIETAPATLPALIAGLSRFLVDRARYLEGTALFEEALTAAEALPLTDQTEPLLAKLRNEIGFFWYQLGRYAEAQAILEPAIPIAEKYELVSTHIGLLKNYGEVLHDQGKRKEALPYIEKALAVSRAAQVDDFEIMPLLNLLANINMDEGHFDISRAYFEEALALAQKAKHTLRIGILFNNMAILASRVEDHPESLRLYQEAHRRFVELKHDWGQAATLQNIGILQTTLGQYGDALASLEESLTAHEVIGHRRGVMGAYASIGTVYRLQGKLVEAEDQFKRSLVLAQEIGVAWSAVSTIVDIAQMEMSRGRGQAALRLLAFAKQHPAIEATTLENATSLYDELRAELPQPIVQAVESADALPTLEELIDELTA